MNTANAMETDPFDAWYASRIDIDEAENYRPAEYDCFFLSYDEGSSEEPQEQQLAMNKVDSYAEKLARVSIPLYGQILLQHHDHQSIPLSSLT